MRDASSSAPGALEISCQGCGAELRVPEHMRTAQCPYCASTSIVDRPATHDRPDPTFVLGFVVGHERASGLVERWIRAGRLFGRSDFRRASFELTRGVYLPAYIFSAIARSEYSASIGEEYTVTETYTTTDSKGRTVTVTRTRTETEWRPLAGRHVAYTSDILVTASRGIANSTLEEIEPFDFRALRRYTPALLSGWISEEPSLTVEECFALARSESLREAERRLNAFMPGDTHRGLEFTTKLEDEVLELALLPIWSFAAVYRPDKPPVKILVNGQTGELCGRVPLSGAKIATAVLIVIAIIAAIVIAIAAGQ